MIALLSTIAEFLKSDSDKRQGAAIAAMSIIVFIASMIILIGVIIYKS